MEKYILSFNNQKRIGVAKLIFKKLISEQRILQGIKRTFLNDKDAN